MTSIVYAGNTYRISNVGYYRRHKRVNEKYKTLFLHREIWKDNFGEIPCAHRIYHKDGNRSNNSINNLKCSLHVVTDEHKNLLRNHWKNRPVLKKQCAVCGEDYECKMSNSIHCSKKCSLRAFIMRKRKQKP